MTDPNAIEQAPRGGSEPPGRHGTDRDSEDGSRLLPFVRLLLLAAVLGLVAAFAAVVFQMVVAGVQNLLWNVLPDAAGWREPPWWYTLVLPCLGGFIVALALRLPGRGGHSPLQGLSTDPLEPLPFVSLLLAGALGSRPASAQTTAQKQRDASPGRSPEVEPAQSR